MAQGALSDPVVPALPGLERFRGHAFHSARWDHGYDLTGNVSGVCPECGVAADTSGRVAPRHGAR